MSLKPPPGSGDHFLGDPKAVTVIVEFGDFECPHCRRAEPLLQRLADSMGDELFFVFRHFPLQEIHPNAHLAALASEAAAQQDKFWEMHALIFKNQDRLSAHTLLDLAESLGLDTRQFGSDWKSPAATEKVEKDFESGIRSGVNGTPTFFLNGNRLMGYDGTYESLVDAIQLDQEMNRS